MDDPEDSLGFKIKEHIHLRTVFLAIGIGVIVYFVLTQWGDLKQTWNSFLNAQWLWLFGALALSALTYFWDALQVVSVVNYRVPLRQAAQVSLGGSFANVFAPAGLGTMGVDELYYRRSANMNATDAVAAVALKTAAGVVVHAILLLTTFAFFGRAVAEKLRIPTRWWELLIIAGVVVAGGAFVSTRLGRRVVVRPVWRALLSMRSTLASPKDAGGLFGASFGLTLTNLAVLVFCLEAYGSTLPLLPVATAFFITSIVATIAPSPGGIGVEEVAYVGTLTALGASSNIAVAAALSFRFLTFWLPILPGMVMLRSLERRKVI